ncbi:MAG: tetraacyldisaccharide 4'-kinase [Bdellovibrionaceae bacterium]|nr:tetraacyldisaccharide 4'-kinase [Pseudobdellovibrionaceae bacterium]
MKPLLSGLAKIHEGLVAGRNYFYDHSWIKIRKVPVPVISLGNLTVGGTGKTPLTDLCLRLLRERGHRPGLVCRSYRASLTGPERVNASRDGAASRYGDEAVWFARRHPESPVWSGPVKSDTAAALAAAENVDVILVDDGFQHRRLHRDLNLVLLDATDDLPAYELLPAGRGREVLSALSRADAVLFTKVNWAGGGVPAPVRARIPAGLPVFSFEFALSPLPAAAGEEDNLLLVSAVARPGAFEALVREQRPRARLEHRRFRDHHAYGAGDVEALLERARALGVSRVFTTEKDEVKLRPLWPATGPSLNALSLEVRPQSSIESFYDVLARAFRPRP